MICIYNVEDLAQGGLDVKGCGNLSFNILLLQPACFFVFKKRRKTLSFCTLLLRCGGGWKLHHPSGLFLRFDDEKFDATAV